jgi:hypothetical protein
MVMPRVKSLSMAQSYKLVLQPIFPTPPTFFVALQKLLPHITLSFCIHSHFLIISIFASLVIIYKFSSAHFLTHATTHITKHEYVAEKI